MNEHSPPLPSLVAPMGVEGRITVGPVILLALSFTNSTRMKKAEAGRAKLHRIRSQRMLTQTKFMCSPEDANCITCWLWIGYETC